MGGTIKNELFETLLVCPVIFAVSRLDEKVPISWEEASLIEQILLIVGPTLCEHDVHCLFVSGFLILERLNCFGKFLGCIILLVSRRRQVRSSILSVSSPPGGVQGGRSPP